MYDKLSYNVEYINDKLYDNVACCKEILRRLLSEEITCHKLMRTHNE